MNLYATCCEPAASSLAVTHYPPIASRDHVVKLLPQQGLLVGRTQIMSTGAPNQIHKAKQHQILPKPFSAYSSPQKQTASRINSVMPQQTPLLINQPQAQNPTLLLNQVLTSGAPVIVQPAGPGGTVHLMLRTPTPTLQSGPGPPGNKMIIANTTQPQPQATVLIQNRQQVVRFMTAQGPMQVQQIQTPSGPQLIAIPQNQSLSFPPNSVLVQGPTTNTLQLQQNSGNAIQVRQSPSAILQANSFPPNSLPNQIFQTNATTSVGLKLDDKPGSTESPSSLPGANDQKKFVIDNKASSKKAPITLNSSSNFNSGNCNTNVNNLNSNLLNNIKNKNAKLSKKAEDEINRIGKNTAKDNSAPAPTAQKNVTSTLRQVRPGTFVNRKNQTADKTDDKSLRNLTKIIESVASNTEHLSSPPSPKTDNVTATINSVAENIKSPADDDDILNINLSDFITENKSLNLNKRPNLTIVQKQKPESEEPVRMNRLMLSPNSSMDFENITKNYDDLELGTITTSAGVQTSEPNFTLEQSTSNQGAFQNQEEGKKAKKKTAGKKKSKREESRVDLWDLMKSAGIGDDEFDDPTDANVFSHDTATLTEPIEISASDSDLLAQLQTASQVPGGIRVVVGEDGRPIIFNGGNVLIPDSVTNTATACTGEPGASEAVLQNMILPDNVFNFTPQAFATAQTQLNQLIQDHGGLATSSADQQLLSQIFGATPSSIESTVATSTTCTNTSMTQSAITPSLPSVQSQSFPSSQDVMVNVGPSAEVDQQAVATQKTEQKPEFIGGPPPGLPPFGPDSLVITNNNGVPTLVASPALMQYLQTHQGVIQFQHDPVTKTIQPSLIIPHPQHKIDLSSQDGRTDKATIVASVRPPLNQNKELNKPRMEAKGSLGTITDDRKNSMTVINSLVPNVIKQNMVKFVKDNPPLLQIAAETNNLINFKEINKNLSDKERVEIDKKIQQNRAILDQCFLMESNRTGALPSTGRIQSVIVKETVSDKPPVSKASAETQTQEDLQTPDVTVKSFHPATNLNTSNSNSDFQAKFLESIGMSNKNFKGGVTSLINTTAKKSRKKKDKNQATQADVKTNVPSLTFNIAELTPEQNVKLNQALQSRGAIMNQIDNLEAIKQIIQEEVRKMTSHPVQCANIRFMHAEHKDDQNMPTANVLVSNASLNQLLEPSAGQGNVISLQGNELVAINSGNQQIFTSQNQILSGNHFVSSNNQILAIGGNPNQLVSLGSPIGSSNPIMALGSPPNMVSVGGNNIASQGAVIVGSNGNVLAILHPSPNSGQGPGIVQRVQTIQLTTPKQQHFKIIQAQIQNLTSKPSRTASEQATLQKLILEQQKLLASGKIVPAVSGQVQGMQIVSESVTNSGRVVQTQTASQQQQSSLTQTVNQTPQPLQQHQQQHHQSQTLISNNTSSSSLNSQSFKANWTAGAQSISCGTNTSDLTPVPQNIPKMSVPPTVLISDSPANNYGPLYVSPNNSNKNVTKCEKGTSPIQIQMGTQTVTNMEYRSGKMSTGTMTSPNTGKPQAVVAPAIVIQQTESQSPTYQMKPRNQTTASEPLRPQVPSLNRTAFIEQQMRTDQGGATMPDTRTPFLSKSDAVKRLIRYHVMDEKALSAQDLATADEIFEATAQHLLDKFRAMKEKYKYLLMLESMREVSTAERIMVDRNFIIEERLELEELREKEKRLQEEFENPTITYSSYDSANIKTEVGEIKTEIKTEVNDLMEPCDIKKEVDEGESEQMISKNRNSDINSDLFKDSSFRLTEANRNLELTKIKSETKECKNTRTPFGSPRDDEFPNISGKCKVKTSRTFSDGSSKSSLDSSKDEDSGTDINAQVQSAIDSILNLQKCETMSESGEDEAATKRSKKKRKHWDKTFGGTKRSKMKGFGKGSEEKGVTVGSDDEDEEDDYEEEDDGDGGDSDADPILDEAIRSILTS